jgi:glucokinase
VDQLILPIESGSFENAINTLIEGIEKIKARNRNKSISTYFGIGSPGLVNSKDGEIISAIDMKWKNVNYNDALRRKTDMIPVIANRSKVSALTSYYLNNPESFGNIISIVIGTGVASGFILDHKLYTGSRSGAGELGHTTIDPNGPACECGNRGCLQALVGEHAILTRAVNHARKKGSPVPESIEDVFRDRDDDSNYVHIIEEVAEYLAVAVGNLINIFNPDLIALSGPIISGFPELLDQVRKRTYHRCMKYNFETVEIISSEWGINTAAIGSTLLVRENIAEALLA